MVREEEKQKKKGWFGRRKSSTPTPQHVSRPPTASSFSKPKPTSTTASATTTTVAGGAAGAATGTAGNDDDLPPRMESPVGDTKPRTSSDITTSGSATPRTPTTPSKKSTEEDAAVAHIPKHAGFDLEAMRKVIGQAQENPSELNIPSTMHNTRSGNLSPPLPVPPRSPVQTPMMEAKRSVSAPFLGGTAEVSEDERKELAKEFARSFSLRDEPDSSVPVERRQERTTPSAPAYGFQEHSSSKVPTLTFGSEFDTPVWGSSPPSTRETATHNPFAMSSQSLSLNDYSYGGFGSSRFGVGADTGLSFGAADGTITSANMNGSGGAFAGSDPWAVPESGKKSSAGFGSNPWS